MPVVGEEEGVVGGEEGVVGEEEGVASIGGSEMLGGVTGEERHTDKT